MARLNKVQINHRILFRRVFQHGADALIMPSVRSTSNFRRLFPLPVIAMDTGNEMKNLCFPIGKVEILRNHLKFDIF